MLDRIRLADFRNHRESELDGSARFNLLTGENGAGKTNVLEAISLLAPGRGLRRAALGEMAAKDGAGGFAVSAELTLPGDQLCAPGDEPVRLGTGTSPERPGRRLVRINGAEGSAMALGEWLSLFWLTPAMDRLFTDSAGARRRFLDRLVLALAPAHAAHAARYDAALRERNHLLAHPDEPDPAWLDAIEAQMAEAGAAVSAARNSLVERLDMALRALPASPFARPVLMLQHGGPEDRDGLVTALAEGRRRDRAAGRSLTGPHRDDLIVTLAAKNQPAATCSTGEQKAMLIAITLAHSELAMGAAERTGPEPVGPEPVGPEPVGPEPTGPEPAGSGRPRLLLLDEVAAHLDPLRRAALFERLAAGPAQVWMTGTEAAPFAGLAATAARWRVTEGRVIREA